jgi:hypothetical protein
MKQIKLLLILSLVLFAGACNSANQGAVSIETYYGKVQRVHQPGDWYTTWSPGYEAWDVDIKPWADDVTVHVGTSDNAGLKLTIKVVGRVKNDNAAILAYVEKFGLEVESRHSKRWQIESGAVQTITRDAVAKHTAYNLYKEQQTIQNEITERLKEVFDRELFSELVSVQITDRPDFDNDDIENAASKVVAAQKQKEAEQQWLEAARIKLEKEQVTNQIYASSPQAFQIRMRELAVEEARAWSQHQGPLSFNGGTSTLLQVPSNR